MSTTEIEFFTPDPVEDGGWLRKEDLLGKLVAYVVRDYNPKHVGKFGTGPRAVVDVIVVGDDGSIEAAQEKFFANGNLAKQLGRVPVGRRGLGRVIQGENQNGGQPWWGIDPTDDQDDIARAKAAVAAAAQF